VSVSVDAGGAGDLCLSVFLGARGRESESFESLGPGGLRFASERRASSFLGFL
jgi:hypothetical protein